MNVRSEEDLFRLIGQILSYNACNVNVEDANETYQKTHIRVRN